MILHPPNITSRHHFPPFVFIGVYLWLIYVDTVAQ